MKENYLNLALRRRQTWNKKCQNLFYFAVLINNLYLD